MALVKELDDFATAVAAKEQLPSGWTFSYWPTVDGYEFEIVTTDNDTISIAIITEKTLETKEALFNSFDEVISKTEERYKTKGKL